MASSAIAKAAPAAVESSLAIIADSALHYSTTTTGDFIDARYHLLMVVALMVTAAIVKVVENLPSRQLSLPYFATTLPPWYLAFAEARCSEAVQVLPWLECCCPDAASAAGRRPNLLSAFD